MRWLSLLLFPFLLWALEPGWNLIGAVREVDGKLLNRDYIEAAFLFRDGAWHYWSRQREFPYERLERIEKGEGVWIFSREARPAALWVERGTSWYWQLQGEIDPSHKVDLYDVDLFDTDRKLIEELHREGKVVICYFSAGSFEEWRPDRERFPKEAIGRPLEGWSGEQWLDIRHPQVRSIMVSRLDLARSKGCDGVEPDNVDGYLHGTGFSLTGDDQLEYNRFLAEEAHKRGLLIALKNDMEQIEELVDLFDFAINEECFTYGECGLYLPFLLQNKAVLNAEYEGLPDCRKAQLYGISSIYLSPDLDGSLFQSCSEAVEE
ncbi:MAG: endo alpha-1,4 polygalactosaminidase [Epsilonproteobacteria bacterium]|nr:endo alpha-1,4 polygalactosaminidase [Campylobacterota bacterium]NPA56354.1 endo alpha-1,4 polygalactosaminidase [Campylobacterota bacterium]